ncbi:DUF1471 domain-containing protein [Musicola keenii]|uniref:DUF1471 domain-containing protein n=1 Tax=Musicola keenii TaxID=2884250 RepID=UPI00178334B0|nr:DUF1471 domain-containing protein [Musicola keenii]
MKNIKNFVAVSILSLVSFGSFAQSLSTTSSTLDGAEAKIAAQAHQQGASYKIISVTGNDSSDIRMVAELTK